MSMLPNPRHETFAKARAKGALLDEAYEAAGFVLAKGHPSRLARRPEVAERIAELRALQADADDTTLPTLLASMARVAKDGLTSENPAVLKEARLALNDAARLRAVLDRHHACDRIDILHED